MVIYPSILACWYSLGYTEKSIKHQWIWFIRKNHPSGPNISMVWILACDQAYGLRISYGCGSIPIYTYINNMNTRMNIDKSQRFVDVNRRALEWFWPIPTRDWRGCPFLGRKSFFGCFFKRRCNNLTSRCDSLTNKTASWRKGNFCFCWFLFWQPSYQNWCLFFFFQGKSCRKAIKSDGLTKLKIENVSSVDIIVKYDKQGCVSPNSLLHILHGSRASAS